ncbi:hypothetical protein TNCT_528161 [Trichonephila clavata]|uniref:Uncharacterized protein n=1 Tax=Trichonephila clavata TaxID=2740835 RepID=A0A8X6J6R8_TRICU|nr:hypothetical protein TNCT_528161 [Trichonephila clavata]
MYFFIVALLVSKHAEDITERKEIRISSNQQNKEELLRKPDLLSLFSFLFPVSVLPESIVCEKQLSCFFRSTIAFRDRVNDWLIQK